MNHTVDDLPFANVIRGMRNNGITLLFVSPLNRTTPNGTINLDYWHHFATL